MDGVLGETVSYQYDSLNRLIAATASSGAWGEAYGFDGFGNLQSKTPTVGSAPTGGGAAPTTNQPAGVSVDANGNTLGTSTPYVWDIENHMISSSTTSPATYFYYDPWGKRFWKETPVDYADYPCEFYFYGIGGQKLETYSCEFLNYGAYTAFPTTPNSGGPMSYTLQGINVYFGPGGKLLQSKGAWVVTDRQGTVRANSSGESFSYFPYGEERTSTANGREKFGTYTRDANGQDYADQRYYNSNSGAFWSPDPGGMRTADPRAPLSWNRYMYVLGDPLNHGDPLGLDNCDVDTGLCVPPPPPPVEDCGDFDCTDDTQTGSGGRGGNVSMTTLGGVGNIVQDPAVTTVIVTATPIDVPTQTSTVATALVTVVTTATEVLVGVVAVLLTQTGDCGSPPCGAPLTGTTTGTGTTSPTDAKYNVTDPQWVELNCTEVGLPIIVPSTSVPGGTSVEQEYLCPDGHNYTIHTLKGPSGKPVGGRHVRPREPKYGIKQ